MHSCLMLQFIPKVTKFMLGCQYEYIIEKFDIYRGLTSNDTSPDLSLLKISLTVSHTISLTYGSSNKNMIIGNHNPE